MGLRAHRVARISPTHRSADDRSAAAWVLEVIMTIEINEPAQRAEAAELPGIILLVALVTILTVICWLSL